MDSYLLMHEFLYFLSYLYLLYTDEWQDPENQFVGKDVTEYLQNVLPNLKD